MHHNTINHNYRGWSDSPGIFTWEPVRKRFGSQIRHTEYGRVVKESESGSQCM